MYLWWIGEGASDHYMMEEVRKLVERTFDLPPPLRRRRCAMARSATLSFPPAP